LIIGQVAVKALQIYAADQLGAAKMKKMKVSFLTQDCGFPYGGCRFVEDKARTQDMRQP
jgi:hypothetical protein